MIDPSSAAEVTPALLAHLATRAGSPAARLRSPLERILGGNQTFVFGLEIEGAPGLEGPLILRIVRDYVPVESVVREAALQNALHEARYPVARVLHACSDPEPLGGAFQLMERLPGVPLVLAGTHPEGTIGLRDAVASFGGFVFGDWPAQLASLHRRLHALPLAPLLDACEKAGLTRADASFDAALERLVLRAQDVGVRELDAPFDWLHTQRPPAFVDAGRQVLCHGDLFPNQVLADRGTISGVIDWADFCTAPPELDVAVVKVGIETLPVPFGAAGRRIVAARARRFFEAYRERAPLDPEALRYAEAFRCTHSLLSLVERRSAQAVDAKRANPNPYDDPRAIAEIAWRVRKLTGCSVTTG